MVLDEAWNITTRTRGHAGVRPVHVAAVVLAVGNFVLNALIWYAFQVYTKVINKSHLHLFFALAVTNCLTGFFSIPTFINLILHNNLNCPRWTIMIGSAFEMGLDRMRAVVAIGIALERVFAIFRPRSFFLMDHSQMAQRVCVVGVVWSVFDMVFMIFEDDIYQVRMHCVSTSSSGTLFHAYFLLSAIVDGLMLLSLYLVFLVKFLSIRKSIPDSTAPRDKPAAKRKGMKELVYQANSLTLTVILCVLVFSILPSCLYSYDLIMNTVYFMDYGPVVTIGYHLHGIASSFCYNYKHKEIRRALDRVYPIRKRTCLAAMSSSGNYEQPGTPGSRKTDLGKRSEASTNAACNDDSKSASIVAVDEKSKMLCPETGDVML